MNPGRVDRLVTLGVCALIASSCRSAVDEPSASARRATAMELATALLEVDSAGIPASVVDATREKLMGAEVGSWVRVLGTLNQEALAAEESAGSGWHALLVHSGPSFTYVLCPDRPTEHGTPGESYIVTGQYCGMHSFLTSSGDGAEAPLLAARHWERFATE